MNNLALAEQSELIISLNEINVRAKAEDPGIGVNKVMGGLRIHDCFKVNGELTKSAKRYWVYGAIARCNFDIKPSEIELSISANSQEQAKLIITTLRKIPNFRKIVDKNEYFDLPSIITLYYSGKNHNLIENARDKGLDIFYNEGVVYLSLR